MNYDESYLSSDDETNMCVSHHYSSDDSDSNDELALQSVQLRLKQRELDPFEEEMAEELDASMLLLKKYSCTGTTSSSSGLGPGVTFGAMKPSHYDNIYFDSDEDEKDEDVKMKRATVSDADLLYDPMLDEKDQLWMDKHMSSGSVPPSKDGKTPKAKKSDAVLNCPACLTMLTTDCQRHAVYGNQYRAMFVFNCNVDNTQKLNFPAKLSKKEVWKNKKAQRKLRSRNKDSVPGPSNECVMKHPTENIDKQVTNDSETTISNPKIDEASHNETSNLSTSNVPQGKSTGSTISNIKLSETDLSNSTESDVKEVSLCNDINMQSRDKSQSGSPSEQSSSNGCLSAGDNTRTDGKSPRKKVRFADTSVVLDDDSYHPVTCAYCNTKVAVLDKEEVYHFFNVITSY